MTPAGIAGPISPWTRSLRGVQALIAALTQAGQQRLQRREYLARETERELARGERRERFEWEKTRAAKAFEAAETERGAAREERRLERYFREHGEYPPTAPAVPRAAGVAPVPGVGVAPEITGTSRAAVAERLARKLVQQEEVALRATGASEAEIAAGTAARYTKAKVQVASMKPVQLRRLERAIPAQPAPVAGARVPEVAPRYPVGLRQRKAAERPRLDPAREAAAAEFAEMLYTGTPEEQATAQQAIGRFADPFLGALRKYIPTTRGEAEVIARRFYAPAITPEQLAAARRRQFGGVAPSRAAEAFEAAPLAGPQRTLAERAGRGLSKIGLPVIEWARERGARSVAPGRVAEAFEAAPAVERREPEPGLGSLDVRYRRYAGETPGRERVTFQEFARLGPESFGY